MYNNCQSTTLCIITVVRTALETLKLNIRLNKYV